MEKTKKGSGTTDLTVGRPLPQILKFALPLVLGTLFQQLYSFVDTVIVGRCLGTDALGAVGTTYSLNFLILGFVLGSCTGFGIPVAQSFGARDSEDMHKYLFNGAVLCVVLSVVVTIVTFAFALVFAAILTREKIKGQNFFRIIFYIPNILSVVVISGIFSAIYKPENGMLNSIIGLFRDMTDPILWKGEKLVIPSIIIAMVWQAVGYYMVMYMASMSSVPASLYESANLDGAGRLTQFFQITIPLIWTNIRTTLTFFIISTINMAFLFVKAMTSGGPNGASDVALSYMYSQKDAGLYGYSMAIGVVIFLFSFALSACVNKATDRDPLEF